MTMLHNSNKCIAQGSAFVNVYAPNIILCLLLSTRKSCGPEKGWNTAPSGGLWSLPFCPSASSCRSARGREGGRSENGGRAVLQMHGRKERVSAGTGFLATQTDTLRRYEPKDLFILSQKIMDFKDVTRQGKNCSRELCCSATWC